MNVEKGGDGILRAWTEALSNCDVSDDAMRFNSATISTSVGTVNKHRNEYENSPTS